MVYLANISSQSLLLGQHKEFSSAAAGGVKKGFFGTCSCAYLNLSLCFLKISFTSLLNSKSFQGFNRTWSISGRTGRRSLVTECFLAGKCAICHYIVDLRKEFAAAAAGSFWVLLGLTVHLKCWIWTALQNHS